MKRLTLLLALFLFASATFAATCKVSEYENMTIDASGRPVPVALEPALFTQTVTYTTSTELTNDFDERTRFVLIVCDAKAHFKFSTDGTNATANDFYVGADTEISRGITRVGLGQTQTLNVEFYDGSS